MVVAGLLLVLTQARNPRTERWLAVKILAVVGIIVVAVTLIEPSEDQLRALAVSVADPGTRAEFTTVALRQEIYGAINLVLIALASALAVFKPRLGGPLARRLPR